MIGFDANDDEIQDLKDGTVDGLIVQNPFGMGYATWWLRQELLLIWEMKL